MKSIKTIIALCFAFVGLFLFAEPVYAATITAPTSITSNTTWTSDNLYIIQSSTTVQAGVKLTIQPGTIIKFQTGTYMNIKGTLDALGTSDNNIIFTSYKDDSYGGDTNGDGSTTTPAKGNWNYLGSYTGGTVNCSYCVIRYSGNNQATIYSTGGELHIDRCSIEMSNSRGIEIKGTASIIDNDISNFTTTGVYVNSGTPIISGNTIIGGNYGIYVANGSPNIINNNSDNNANTAIYVANGFPVIKDNTLNGGSGNNYGIVVANGTIDIENNTISQFPNYEAIKLGSDGSTITGSVNGNTMVSCKYPLGFVEDKIPSITFDSNNVSGCSIHGINLYVSLGSQTVPVYNLP